MVSPGKLKRLLTAIITSNHSRMLFATKHFSPTHVLLPWLFWVGLFAVAGNCIYFILYPLLSQRQGKPCSSIRKQVMFAVFDLLPFKNVSSLHSYCSYLKNMKFIHCLSRCWKYRLQLSGFIRHFFLMHCDVEQWGLCFSKISSKPNILETEYFQFVMEF